MRRGTLPFEGYHSFPWCTFKSVCCAIGNSIRSVDMDIFTSIKKEILDFRDERDWEQFHNAKDLAIALNVESSELLEEFLWKDADKADLKAVEEEVADVVIYSILLADRCGISLVDAIRNKLASNRIKYPVEKAKGSAEKYTKL
jgi:NTP pyrophosphatase (non-canonical NTP hydrolase)